MDFKTTIVALGTAPGICAIHIIRLSGVDAYNIINKVTQKMVLKKGQIFEHNFIIDEQKQLLDDVILVKFVAPHSYTGEDLIEINCHGNMLIVQLIIDLLIKKGATLAEKGEFSKRAFFNNKLDLKQAEAVLSLINAKSKQSLLISAHHLTKKDSDLVKGWITTLFNLISRIEINIDYPDTDIANETQFINELIQELLEIKSSLTKYVKNFALTKTSNFRIALVGKPNVGKSSIFNYLIGQERVIVSDIAGTTRDVVETDWYFNNHYLTLVDTAGINAETSDPIEKIGVQKTYAEIAKADLILWIKNYQIQPDDQEEKQIFNLIKNKDFLEIYNKVDLVEKVKFEGIKISVLKADFSQLLAALNHFLTNLQFDQTISVGSVNSRVRNLLFIALEKITCAIDKLAINEPIDLVLIFIEQVHNNLLEVIGKSLDFDKINAIFDNFCVGK